MSELWNSGDQYDYFMGRWSKLMAPVFLKWLNFSYNLSWLDIGCGTGALSEAIYRTCKPAHLSCIDPSAEYIKKARTRLSDKGDFLIGSSSKIPKADYTFDMVVSGLALNFFPDLKNALKEMRRVLKVNGTMAAYVWDYADRMEFLRIFWDMACQIDPGALNLDEGTRFPICNTNNLRAAFQEAGLNDIETSYLEIKTVFSNFEDYWNPFLGGQGPAPAYLASLSENIQKDLKTTVRDKLPIEPDGSIKLTARGIAIRGISKQSGR